MFHVGIDLHQKYSQVCELSEDGIVQAECQIPTTEAALRRWFGGREDLRIVVESSGTSRWVARLLVEMGHDVIVVNPRRVRLIAESTLKTDRIDAEVLARLSCFGSALLPTVYQRSEDAAAVQTRLRVRSTLVRSKVAMVNCLKGSVRNRGYRLRGQTVQRVIANFVTIELPTDLRQALDPLLESLLEVDGRLRTLNADFKQRSVESELLRRLQTIPGVGPVVSLAYVSWIDDPSRFKSSRQVGPYLGLRPRVRRSADIEIRGRITREGNPELRALLVQAAHGFLRTRRDSTLKSWTVDLEKRVGKKKAIVALARKLAVLMHRLWVTGDDFAPFPAT
jgi:transposase